MKRILLIIILAFSAFMGANAQIVNSKVVDDGGSGPFKAIVVSEASLPGFTVYRPEKLLESAGTDGTLPIIIFGNGGCANSSLGHERFLNDLASYGYVVVAIGPFQMSREPRPGQGGMSSSESYQMFQALDWITNQSRDE